MPNIKTFDAPQLGLRPSEVGVEAAAGAARRVQGLYNQRADALTNEGQRIGRGIGAFGEAAAQQVEHAEISHGSASMMGLINSQTNAWNETAKNADPNDTTIKDKFVNETLNPALEQFEGSFTTQRGQDWARARVDQFRQHMNEKTGADMSSLAADAVHMNVNKSVNLAINTVSNDPSSLDFLRSTIKGTIGDIADSSPNLTPQANAKVKGDIGFAAERELVHAAISATIAKGGDWKAMADDPKNAAFINRAELNTLDKQAQAEARHTEIEQKNLKTAQQQDTDRQAGQKINSIVSNITYDDSDQPHIPPGTVKKLADVLRNSPGASERVRKDIEGEIARIGKTQGKPITADDQTIKSDLNTRMMDPQNPTTRLQVLEAQDKLTPRTFRQLEAIQKEVEGGHLHEPGWKAVMESTKKALGTDPIGAEKYGQWAPGFMSSYLSAKRAGTLEPNALDTNDPDSMISKSMANYKRTPMQQTMDRLSHGLLTPDQANAAINAATNVKPTTVRQNGHTYQRQPDGSMKAID